MSRSKIGEKTDAVTAHQGALLPFGGLEGGYKGFGLALAMDALGALTAGIRPADAVSGYMFFAFKPDLFVSPDAYRHELGRRIAAIKAHAAAAGNHRDPHSGRA
jgi:LDH2 family malate/lactate/ureidoglycolate dehydrogenase